MEDISLKISRLGVQASMGSDWKKFVTFLCLDDEYFLCQKDLEQQATLNAPACVFLLVFYKLSQMLGLEYLMNGKVSSQKQVSNIVAFYI